MAGQYATEEDLNKIKGLLHYLNTNWSAADLAVDVKLVDANGDLLGTVQITESGTYGLVFP